MLSISHHPSILARIIPVNNLPHKLGGLVVCCARGPRPRFPRVWKTQKRIGTISKSQKLVHSIKELSNVKEEVYGALDSFIAWELEFPLIIVKKALKTLEFQKEWKRIIQMVKWMLSKGQGQTMGSYYTLLNALAEDGRLEEAEELWTKIFSQYLESLPRIFFTKMISLYYNKGLHDKMFEVFADMEELRVRPDQRTVRVVGEVFQRLGMLDKYEKLHKKYPPPKWEYRYFKGKRVKIRVKQSSSPDNNESGSEIRAKYLGASNGNKSEIEMPEELLTVSDDDEAETTMQLPASDDDEPKTTMQLPASDDDEAETTMKLPASDDDEAETTMQLPASDDDEAEITMQLPASDDDEAETTMQLSASDDDEAETTIELILLPASDDDEAETTMQLPAFDGDEAEAQIGMEQFTVTE